MQAFCDCGVRAMDPYWSRYWSVKRSDDGELLVLQHLDTYDVPKVTTRNKLTNSLTPNLPQKTHVNVRRTANTKSINLFESSHLWVLVFWSCPLFPLSLTSCTWLVGAPRASASWHRKLVLRQALRLAIATLCFQSKNDCWTTDIAANGIRRSETYCSVVNIQVTVLASGGYESSFWAKGDREQRFCIFCKNTKTCSTGRIP